jgi:putative nucleotidyltransferase with HDIG domain
VARLRERETWRVHGRRAALAGALALLTFALFPEAPATQIPIYEVGAVATDNVIAPYAFNVPKSEEELRRERDEITRSAEPIFRYVGAALDTTRGLVEQFENSIDSVTAEDPENFAAIARVGRRFGVVLDPAEAAYLATPSRRDRMFSAIRRVNDRWTTLGVASSSAVDQVRGELLLRRDDTERRMTVDSLLSFVQLIERARALNPDSRSEIASSLYLKIITSTFRPTVVLDRAETERRRDEFRRTVPINKYAVLAGEKIVGAHEVVGREEHDKLRALQETLGTRRAAEPRITRAVGAILFDFVILVLLGIAVGQFRPKVYSNWRAMVVVAVMIAIVLSISALIAQMRPVRPELVPVTLVAVVASALFDRRISMVIVMIVAILIGAQAPFRGTNALFVNLVGGAIAALSVRAVARRHQSYLWLITTALAYLLATIAIGLMLDHPAATIARSAGQGVLNALGSITVALLLLPIAESYTGIETDLTLLEWSDLNRPLMKRLSLEAPGTFAHTMVIANLAESACRAIGANGMLARVGAYYHDIGKLGRPEFFVENQQRDHRGIHEMVDPAASARIVREHVTEGLLLAEQAGVPRVLRAFITEHHGTGQISYFLGKARENGTQVDPAEFVYPGPIPQSAETAVVMLADGVEAATRVLNEPTPHRVREVIEHIVRQRLEQGQLREAPLNLRQLEIVKAEFARILSGMYHRRIEYPTSSGGVGAEFAATVK